MSSSSLSPGTSNLFHPIALGNLILSHRVVLAPLTRCRANKAHAHGDLGVEYYAQRASIPGTLLITEATYIAQKAGGRDHIPGIYTQDQIDGWKRITDAVHEKGCFVFLQIWGLGRAADADILRSEDPSFSVVSSSAINLSDEPEKNTPRELTNAEIQEYIQMFADAALNAVHKAGFDGVEIHGAHGYLVDQFTQDMTNQRSDDYGGSVENRCKFAFEVVEAVVHAVGAKKTAIRLSPWSRWQDMRMHDPIPTFTHLITRIRDSFPNLAYLSLVEPHISGPLDDLTSPPKDANGYTQVESNDFARNIWSPRPIISAGYHSIEEVVNAAEKGDIVALGRYFISNPDLPLRIRKGVSWAPYERKTFYVPESPVGYVDYPFVDTLEGQWKKGNTQKESSMNLYLCPIVQ